MVRTVLVKGGINPGLGRDGANYSFSSPAAVGNTLYFIANDTLTGYELWKSDGTTVGTVQVIDLNPGVANGSSQILD